MFKIGEGISILAAGTSLGKLLLAKYYGWKLDGWKKSLQIVQ